jgi:CCR4-NOT transcription complex subunit 1
MRNLVLSAFPRAMRLPDPFTPNLKVDLLPEIAAPPRFVPAPEALLPPQLRAEVDAFLAGRPSPSGAPPAAFLASLRARLSLAPADALACGTRYNVPLVNGLAFYVGARAVEASPPTPGTSPPMATPHMELFKHLLRDLDTGECGGGQGALTRLCRPCTCAAPARCGLSPLRTHTRAPPPPPLLPAEGRYLLLNALANHLRFPNAHTHYFSCALLALFTDAGSELAQEQITRVLLERLIVNRWVGGWGGGGYVGRGEAEGSAAGQGGAAPLPATCTASASMHCALIAR